MCPGGTCIGIGSGGPLLDTIRTVAGPKTAQTLHVNIAMLHRRLRPQHPDTRDRTQPTLSSNCGSVAATTSLSGARYGKNMTSTKPEIYNVRNATGLGLSHGYRQYAQKIW